MIEILKTIATKTTEVQEIGKKLPTGTITITEILNPIFFFIGILAVIMIIYGGIQYTSSAGDAGKVTKAKSTSQ